MQKWFYDAFINNPTDNEGRSRIRSKTFDGIAKAMAEQWSSFCELTDEQQRHVLLKNTDMPKKLF